MMAPRLFENDGQLAYSIILRDRQIDEYEKEIDRLCLEFMVRQQPAAGPPGSSTPQSRSTRNSNASATTPSVARQGLLINSLDVDIDYSKFKAISEISIPMLGNAVDAFLDQDADLAKSTMAVEKEANRLRDEINVDLFGYGLTGKSQWRHDALQTVARRFERVADQSKNICEETLYMCTGQYMKHIGKEVFRVLFVDTTTPG